VVAIRILFGRVPDVECCALKELLSWLLDALHEDLNRVQNKPPVTDPGMNGFPPLLSLSLFVVD
jgi:hypothetical protein